MHIRTKAFYVFNVRSSVAALKPIREWIEAAISFSLEFKIDENKLILGLFWPAQNVRSWPFKVKLGLLKHNQ